MKFLPPDSNSKNNQQQSKPAGGNVHQVRLRDVPPGESTQASVILRCRRWWPCVPGFQINIIGISFKSERFVKTSEMGTHLQVPVTRAFLISEYAPSYIISASNMLLDLPCILISYTPPSVRLGNSNWRKKTSLLIEHCLSAGFLFI